MLIAFHKPYGVLSQFTPDQPGQRTLAEFGFPSRVYPLGRLDLDSEGLLLLGDDGRLKADLLDPRNSHWRTYHVQVEGAPRDADLAPLREGVLLQGRLTLPARAFVLDGPPSLAPRIPPVRFRASIPTTWIAVELREGRNRQVRRMTAAAGFPTLRLVRVRIGRYALPDDLVPGAWKELGPRDLAAVCAS